MTEIVICSHHARYDQIVSKAEPSKPISTCRRCTLELTSFDPVTKQKPDFKIHFLSNRYVTHKEKRFSVPHSGRHDNDGFLSNDY